MVDLLRALEEALVENFQNPEKSPEIERSFETSDEAVEILRNESFEGEHEDQPQ